MAVNSNGPPMAAVALHNVAESPFSGCSEVQTPINLTAKQAGTLQCVPDDILPPEQLDIKHWPSAANGAPSKHNPRILPQDGTVVDFEQWVFDLGLEPWVLLGFLGGGASMALSCPACGVQHFAQPSCETPPILPKIKCPAGPGASSFFLFCEMPAQGLLSKMFNFGESHSKNGGS